MDVPRRAFLRASIGGLAALVGCRAAQLQGKGAVSLAPRARAPRWEPARTWAFFVGVLEWRDQSFGSFPKEGRRDVELFEALKARGVPHAQIVMLLDDAATKSAIESAFVSHLAKANPGDTLWLYYAGHGDQEKTGETAFVPYDAEANDLSTSWSVTSMFDAIEAHFQGARAILTADCCFSGALSDEAKRRAPTARVGYGALTSALSKESSTDAWTYTDCLLAGVRGDARIDLDDDGDVGFGELSRHTEQQMAFVEGQLSSSVTSGAFPLSLSLAEAGKKADPRTLERVEVESEGEWFRAEILAVDGERRRVHYLGWDASEDEWVTPERVRGWTPVQLAIGAAVEVEWEDAWYPAHVLDEKLGVHFITYDDDDPAWNEWVTPQRIRRPGDDAALATAAVSPRLHARTPR